jgi:hypothetical protein
VCSIDLGILRTYPKSLARSADFVPRAEVSILGIEIDSHAHAARVGIQQHAMLVMKHTDHEQLLPPMSLQARKPCARSDQRVDRIKTAPNLVNLATYCCVNSRPALLFAKAAQKPSAMSTRRKASRALLRSNRGRCLRRSELCLQ